MKVFIDRPVVTIFLVCICIAVNFIIFGMTSLDTTSFVYTFVNNSEAYDIRAMCQFHAWIGEHAPSLRGLVINREEKLPRDFPPVSAKSSYGLLQNMTRPLFDMYIQRVRRRYQMAGLACVALGTNPNDKSWSFVLSNNLPRVLAFHPFGGMGDRLTALMGMFLTSIVTDSIFVRLDNIPVSMIRFVKPISDDIWYMHQDSKAAENVSFPLLGTEMWDESPSWLKERTFHRDCRNGNCPESVLRDMGTFLRQNYKIFNNFVILSSTNQGWTRAIMNHANYVQARKEYGIDKLTENQLNYLSFSILYGPLSERMKTFREELYKSVQSKIGYHPAKPRRASIVDTRVHEEKLDDSNDGRRFAFDVAVHLRVGTNTDFGEVAPRLPQYAWREMGARAALQCAAVHSSMTYEPLIDQKGDANLNTHNSSSTNARRRPCLVLVLGDSSRAIDNVIAYLNLLPDIAAFKTNGTMTHWAANQYSLPGENRSSKSQKSETPQQRVEKMTLGHQRTFLDFYEMARDAAFIVASRSQLSHTAAVAAGVPCVIYRGIQPFAMNVTIDNEFDGKRYNVYNLSPYAQDVKQGHKLMVDASNATAAKEPLRPLRGAFYWL